MLDTHDVIVHIKACRYKRANCMVIPLFEHCQNTSFFASLFACKWYVPCIRNTDIESIKEQLAVTCPWNMVLDGHPNQMAMPKSLKGRKNHVCNNNEKLNKAKTRGNVMSESRLSPYLINCSAYKADDDADLFHFDVLPILLTNHFRCDLNYFIMKNH